MSSYVDNRSFEEIVLSTTANKEHEYVVFDIIRDVETGLRHCYYKPDKHNSHNAEIARMNAEKAKCEADIKSNMALLETLDNNIKCARLPPNNPNYRKSRQDEITNWDRQYVEAEEEIFTDSKRIEELEGLLIEWNWNAYLEDTLSNTLWRLTTKYRKDKDRDFLARGVTAIYNYVLKSRKNLVKTTQEESYPEQQVKSDVSKDRTNW